MNFQQLRSVREAARRDFNLTEVLHNSLIVHSAQPHEVARASGLAYVFGSTASIIWPLSARSRSSWASGPIACARRSLATTPSAPGV